MIQLPTKITDALIEFCRYTACELHRVETLENYEMLRHARFCDSTTLIAVCIRKIIFSYEEICYILEAGYGESLLFPIKYSDNDNHTSLLEKVFFTVYSNPTINPEDAVSIKLGSYQGTRWPPLEYVDFIYTTDKDKLSTLYKLNALGALTRLKLSEEERSKMQFLEQTWIVEYDSDNNKFIPIKKPLVEYGFTSLE